MAGSKGQSGSNNARIVRTEAYAEKIRRMFAETVNEILELNRTLPDIASGVMYSFDGDTKRVQAKVEMLLRRLHSSATLAIKEGVAVEWEQANLECDKLVKSAFGQEVLSSSEFAAWRKRNTDARDAFINRSEKGLNLSDRVWKSVRQLRDEMEVAITVSVGDGTSARNISRQVRQYLNDPDLMFRRFRYKKGEKDIIDPETGDVIGKQPVYGLKWKKRIKGEDGRYRFIDYDKSEYQDEWTGKGYYKSSAQNAMRVARTETNIAYRRADHERWQQMDFVIGQRIQTAHDHKEKDICDKLKGDYPKDFVFDGWHPQCFCFATPILLDDRYTDSMEDMFLRGEDWEGYIRKRAEEHSIRELPDSFKRWVSENGEKIAASRKRGTEPYFLRENRAAVDGILGKKQSVKVEDTIVGRDAAGNPITHEEWYGTPPAGKKPTASQDAIKAAKAEYDSLPDKEWHKDKFYEATGGFLVTHVLKDKDNLKRAGIRQEVLVSEILAMQGNEVYRLPENVLSKIDEITILGKPYREYLKFKGGSEVPRGYPDLLFNGETWDVKYINGNVETIRKAIKDGRKADNVIFYAEDFIREKDVKDAIEREVGKYNSIGKNTNELPNVYMFDGEKLVRIK